VIKAKGTFVSKGALHGFDGDKPNSVHVIAHADDHSSQLTFVNRPATDSAVIDHRYSRRGATIPED
jgi:hypothetical protein